MHLSDAAPLVAKKSYSASDDGALVWTGASLGMASAEPPPRTRPTGKVLLFGPTKYANSSYWGTEVPIIGAGSTSALTYGDTLQVVAAPFILPMGSTSVASYKTISCLTVGALDVAQLSDWWIAPNKVRAPWAQIERKLTEFAAYEFGWDGDRAPPIAPKTIQVAKALVAKLLSLNAPFPAAVVAYDDGEVELQWRRGEHFAAIAVDASQKVTAFVRARPGEKPLALECDRPASVNLSPFVEALGSM